MRDIGQDRASWVVSTEKDNVARELERLRDEDTVLETTGGSGTVDVDIEVTGAVPEFTGVPAGIQQFYTAPLLQEGAIDSVLFNRSSFFRNEPCQDVSNATGFGTDTLVVRGLTSADSPIAFKFSDDLAITEIPATPDNVIDASSGFCSQSNADFIVTQLYTNREAGGPALPRVLVIRNGLAYKLTLSAPSGMVAAFRSGISEDGQSICVYWGSKSVNTAPFGGTILLAFYSPITGNLLGTTPPFTVTSPPPNYAVISNGWAFVVGNSVYAARANYDVGNQFYQIPLGGAVAPSSNTFRSGGASNITDDNVHFYVGTPGFTQNNLYRVNLETKAVSTYPNALLRFNNGVQVGSILPYSIVGIDSTNLLMGGVETYSDGVTTRFRPIYCAINIVGSNLYISDSLYTDYNTTNQTTGNSTGVTGICVTTDSDVVYCVARMDTVASNDGFLVKVTGP